MDVKCHYWSSGHQSNGSTSGWTLDSRSLGSGFKCHQDLGFSRSSGFFLQKITRTLVLHKGVQIWSSGSQVKLVWLGWVWRLGCRRCLDDISTLPQFSGRSGSAWGGWHHNSKFLEPGPFLERLWSPSWYSNWLKQAGVPGLFLLTLVWLGAWKNFQLLISKGTKRPTITFLSPTTDPPFIGSIIAPLACTVLGLVFSATNGQA